MKLTSLLFIISLLLSTGSICKTEPAKTHIVQAATGETLTFKPASLTIEVGDTVTFVFVGNHRIKTQANAGDCSPIEKGTINFQGIAGNHSVTFTKAEEIYYYCASWNHCTQGMEGQITVVELSTNDNMNTSANGDISSESSGTKTPATGAATTVANLTGIFGLAFF